MIKFTIDNPLSVIRYFWWIKCFWFLFLLTNLHERCTDTPLELELWCINSRFQVSKSWSRCYFLKYIGRSRNASIFYNSKDFQRLIDDYLIIWLSKSFGTPAYSGLIILRIRFNKFLLLMRQLLAIQFFNWLYVN